MILNLRLTALGRVDRPRLRMLEPGNGSPARAQKGTRAVVFDALVECPIYERSRLAAGDRITGPAIVEQMDTTTVIPAGATSVVDPAGSMIVELH